MESNSSFRCDKSHQSDASLASSWTSFSSDEETEQSDGYSESSERDSFDPTMPPRRLFGLPYPLLFCCILSIFLFLCRMCSTRVGDPSSELLSPPPPQQLMVTTAGHDVDALVFVALGPKAISPAFTWSVNSAVEVGGWSGPVYVVTDDTEATQKVFEDTAKGHGLQPANLHVVQPLESSKLHVNLHSGSDEVTYKARLTKCQLLRILPKELKHVLYIDADIMIGKPLTQLLGELSLIWNKGHDQITEMALFPDCKAFTAGFCLDCDTWNTGVMSLRREASDACMDKWCEELTAHAGSDQAALDRVISQGYCQNIKTLDHKQHLRMMKDIFVLGGLIPEKTFNHFTQLFRPRKLTLLYQWFYSRKLGKDVHKLVPQSDGMEKSYFAKRAS